MSGSREAFEQAIENEHPDDYSFDFDPNGYYRDEILERHWWAWQQASSQAGDGEPGSEQVVGRVHQYTDCSRAVLNSEGRKLPDNAPLYAHDKY